MKKQKFAQNSPKLKKVSIAKLNAINGGNEDPDQDLDITLKTHCCTVYPYCLHTLTTRPDSINPGGNDRDVTGG